MTDHTAAQQHEDVYPSRCALEAQFIERQDPTVHATDWKEGPISEDQVRFFAENGFLILNDIFSAEELNALQAEQVRLREVASEEHPLETISEADSGDMRSVFQVHKISDTFSKLSADQRLASVARFLLNDDVYIHQSRLNYKPGFRGKEFYWHSDFETWHVEDGMPRMRALSMSITLTENHEFNGP